jgi:TatD DNase family protein
MPNGTSPAAQAMLIDSHCHLDYLARDEDLDDVVARARDAGLGGMVTICTKVSEFDEIRAIAEKYDDIWCTVGIHPHEADTEPVVSAERLAELAAHPKVIGIGECGLDYYYEHSSRDAQQRSFRTHIEASRMTGLPLIVHTRDADDDTVAILQDEYTKGEFPGLIHCYSASHDLAKKSLEIGFYISLSGIVTFKSAQTLRETVRTLPINRILVETDAPYLAPNPKRGKRNEPAFIAHTAAAVAELKSMSVGDLTTATTANFFRLFAHARSTGSGDVAFVDGTSENKPGRK